MIRIEVHADGYVTGDIGRIMAYRDQTYSEPIQVLHPSYSGAIYKLNYTWGHTSYTDLLNANDTASIHIHGVGRVRLQFVAENVLTGETYLASKPFDLIVHEGFMQGPNKFTNDRLSFYHHNHYDYPNQSSNGMVEMIAKLNVEVAEESHIRSDQDSMLWEEIYKIKNALADAGIIFKDDTPKTYDCNKLWDPGDYLLDELSTHTPIALRKFKVQVRRYTDTAIQTAYLISEGDTGVYYRTGALNPQSGNVWEDWTPMIHEVTIREVE